MRATAAVLYEIKKPVVVEDIDVLDPGPHEVRVRWTANGVCHSDLHVITGDYPHPLPVVLGHEAAGVVATVGTEVEGWHEGDPVTFDPTLHCGSCPACTAGATNLCEQRRIVGAAFGGVRTDGAFADSVVLPARALVRLPAGLPFERAAFAEPLAVALHAVRLAGVGPGATVVVVGTGIIGLLAVQALRVAGVERVIGVDVDERKLALARRLGADKAVLAADARADIGADAAIEAVGSAAALRTAVESVRRGGRVVVVGNLVPTVELPLQALVTGELTVVGSCAFAGELEHSVELLARAEVDVEPLVGAVAPLAEGASWFERLHAAEPGLLKVILRPGAA
jgi:L-iditol 2-dehydrogenase